MEDMEAMTKPWLESYYFTPRIGFCIEYLIWKITIITLVGKIRVVYSELFLKLRNYSRDQSSPPSPHRVPACWSPAPGRLAFRPGPATRGTFLSSNWRWDWREGAGPRRGREVFLCEDIRPGGVTRKRTETRLLVLSARLTIYQTRRFCHKMVFCQTE